jgi:hypothetical protein
MSVQNSFLKKYLETNPTVCAILLEPNENTGNINPDNILDHCIIACKNNYIATQAGDADYDYDTIKVYGFPRSDYVLTSECFYSDEKSYPVYRLLAKKASEAVELDAKTLTGTSEPRSRLSVCQDLIYMLINYSRCDKNVLDDMCVALCHCIYNGHKSGAVANPSKKIDNDFSLLLDYEPIISVCNLLDINGNEFKGVSGGLSEDDVCSLCESLSVVKNVECLKAAYTWYYSVVSKFSTDQTKIESVYPKEISSGVFKKLEARTSKLKQEYDVENGWKVKILRHMIRVCLHTKRIKKIMLLVSYDGFNNCDQELYKHFVNTEDAISPRIAPKILDSLTSGIKEERAHGILMSYKSFMARYNHIIAISAEKNNLGTLFGKC